MKRLATLNRKLKRQMGVTPAYGEIIEEQREQAWWRKQMGLVLVIGNSTSFLPHKSVVRATAESTKLRIVYDASVRASDGVLSLNDCLHAGLPLQNKLWSVLVRGRFNPVAVNGDLQKAFLQVRIREADLDAMRFHLYSDLQVRFLDSPVLPFFSEELLRYTLATGRRKNLKWRKKSARSCTSMI